MKIDLDFKQRLRILTINNPTSIYIYIHIYTFYSEQIFEKGERYQRGYKTQGRSG